MKIARNLALGAALLLTGACQVNVDEDFQSNLENQVEAMESDIENATRDAERSVENAADAIEGQAGRLENGIDVDVDFGGDRETAAPSNTN
jgi:hypothetical protein